MTLSRADLARLRGRAARAMREDASPEDAAAREQLLQVYRDRLLDHGHFDLSGALGRSAPFGEEDLEGVAWIGALAAAGHVPAAALLERALNRQRIAELQAAAPLRVTALAPKVPPLARREALAALAREEPDLNRIARLLQASGPGCAPVLEALRVLLRLGMPVSRDDREALAATVGDAAGGASREVITRSLLARLALHRFASEDARERSAGEQLLAHVDPSRRSVLPWLAATVAKAPRFMLAWLAENRDPLAASKAARLKAAIGFETGEAGGAPDLGEASRWYAFAIDGTPDTGGEAGSGNPKLCFAAGMQLELYFADRDPRLWPLVRAWYERGIGSGEPRCLARWLHCCVSGNPDFPADPGSAIAQLARYAAAAPGTDPRREFSSRLVPAIVARARAGLADGTPQGRAAALGWSELGARLGEAESRDMLTAISGGPGSTT